MGEQGIWGQYANKAKIAGLEFLVSHLRTVTREVHPGIMEGARGHLKKGALIVAHNHLSMADGLLVARELGKELGPQVHYVFPTSVKFFDGRIGGDTMPLALDALSRKLNMAFLPIVQQGDERYEEQQISSEGKRVTVMSAEGRRVNRESLVRMKQSVQQSGTVLIIAPEGRRSRSGALERAQSGAAKLLDAAANGLLLPVALTGSERIQTPNTKKINPFAQTQLAWLPLVAPEDLDSLELETGIPAHDLVMLHIAQHLPEQYRGHYSQFNPEAMFERWYAQQTGV